MASFMGPPFAEILAGERGAGQWFIGRAQGYREEERERYSVEGLRNHFCLPCPEAAFSDWAFFTAESNVKYFRARSPFSLENATA